MTCIWETKNRYVILDIMKVTGSKKDCAYFEGKKKQPYNQNVELFTDSNTYF